MDPRAEIKVAPIDVVPLESVYFTMVFSIILDMLVRLSITLNVMYNVAMFKETTCVNADTCHVQTM